MDTNLLHSHLVFRIPTREEVQGCIDNYLTKNHTEEKFVELIALDDVEFVDALPAVLLKYGEDEPSREEIARVAIRWLAQKIAENIIDTYEGAKQISFQIEQECDDYNLLFGVPSFTALVSEYDDFFGKQQIAFYGRDKCKEFQKGIIEKIRARANVITGDTNSLIA